MNEKIEFKDGDVVICSTSQAGSVIQLTGKKVWVLLTNKDLWVGNIGQIRFPQDQADLDACPLDVERLATKSTPKPNRRHSEED